MLLHLEFTLNFSTIFVDSFNIRASQEVFPTEVRSPEIADDEQAKRRWLTISSAWLVKTALSLFVYAAYVYFGK